MKAKNLVNDLSKFDEIFIVVDNADRYNIFKKLFGKFHTNVVFLHTNVYSYLSAKKNDKLNRQQILLRKSYNSKKPKNLSIEEVKWNRRYDWTVDINSISLKKNSKQAWIVWGGFQYSWQCLKSSLEIKNVYYFEIANFPGKLQWSKSGVNAYGHYADKVNEIKGNKNENVVSPIELKKIINTWHPPHADRRLIDQALEQLINNVFAGLFKSLAPKTTITNAIKTVYATIRSRRLITKLRDNNLPNKYDLFIGQVSEDSQTVFQSQETQISAIKKAHFLAKNSKKQLVVRLHPAEKNISVLKEVQQFCVLNKIVISNFGSLGTAVEGADNIYTINSTGGAHALLYGKSVTTFGEAFYSGWMPEDVCIYYNDLLIDQDFQFLGH